MNVVWFQGEFVDGPLAIDPTERGLLLGDGLFETLAVIDQKPLWLNQHLKRLEAAAREVGITYDSVYIFATINRVLAHWPETSGVMRITLTRGAVARGLALGGEAPSLMISISTFDEALRFAPCTLGLVDVVRHSMSPSTRLKTLSYFDNVMAARQAASLGFDEALMLNEHGHVACSSVGNLFLVKGTSLITPQLDQAILPGIMRQVILDLAPRLGFDISEGQISFSELANADGVFISNSLRILRPVSQFGTTIYHQRYDDMIDLLKTEIGMNR